MKTKSALVALALVSAVALSAQLSSVATVTLSIDWLTNSAAINRNTSRVLAPVSAYAAGYFQGKADAQEEIAALKGP